MAKVTLTDQASDASVTFDVPYAIFSREDADFGPYLEFVRIQTEMNKLFESLQELRDPDISPDARAGLWVPNVDICETVEALTKVRTALGR